MKSGFGWFVLGLALIGLVAWRFSTKDAEASEQKQQSGQRRGGGSSVEVATVVEGSLVETIEAVGTVESPFRVQISPKVSGRIEFIQAREGDPVEPGQVMVRLDETEIRGQVLQQQANLAEAKSRLAQAKLNQTPTTVGVSSQIAQQEANLSSAKADQEQVERNYEALVGNARSDAADAEARLEAAKAQSRNAQAEVERQTASLSNAKAKFDRAKSLFDRGFISAQAYDDARTAFDVQKAALRVAEGQKSAAESAVQSANSVLSARKSQVDIVSRKGKADIAAAQAKVKQAMAGLDLAQANKSIPPAFQQNLEALSADVNVADAQLKQAESRLSETSLKSPIKGTVTARRGEIGNLATPGQSIMEVQFLDWVYVTTSVPVERTKDVKEGSEATLTFDALPGRQFKGPITNVNLVADTQTRQFSVRIRLENPGRAIRPGMFGRVRIPTGKASFGPLVPREAITGTPSGPTVAVIDDKMTASVRQVKVGATDGAKVLILEGVKPGEKVVTLSYSPVRDGGKVTLSGGREGGGSGGGGARGSGPGGQGGGRGAP